MEINLKLLNGIALTLGKLTGYIVIFIGIIMTFLLLKTILFD
ncbi:MAG: hypothetical protein PHH85_09865 [Candidatus Methanoperedens sp.]|nr:hypothetical protein [Candidatus Methanoperedens sp.]